MTDTKRTSLRKGRPPRQAFGGVELDALGIDEELNAIAATDTAPLPVERPAMRPAMREEDPRAAAARRAAEIRGHLGTMDEGTDEFAAPPPPTSGSARRFLVRKIRLIRFIWPVWVGNPCRLPAIQK